MNPISSISNLSDKDFCYSEIGYFTGKGIHLHNEMENFDMISHCGYIPKDITDILHGIEVKDYPVIR